MAIPVYKISPPVPRLRLQFLPSNGCHAFTFGDALVRLHVASVTLYGRKEEAIADARLCGLTVDDEGEVSLLDREPADAPAFKRLPEWDALPAFKRYEACTECGANIPRFATAATHALHAPTCSRFQRMTVTYKGRSTASCEVQNLAHARTVCLAWVEQHGPDAWRNTTVTDGLGQEYKPAELWGGIK
jgi:hypothetical protein